ncbi:hypothetical protein FNV43_RR12179 [Rhamnella rubrinervis]|uniref:Protein disulfide-isomerase n=1 Tax=Rhamnella rubrinervis TaxID=2594499 RepID=A0A8K0H7P8_9ROSA|nr:hypothetical protein FNV43_RR12179 [Rhamnella rubrinervis]
MTVASRVSLCSFLVVFCFLASALAGIYAEGEESEPKEFVVSLDQSNFTDFVSKHDFIVVEFYAPWCGACKALAPLYEEAASILSSNDPPVVLAKVDAVEEVNKELASQYEVDGYPTIKILRNGGKTIQEYKGLRESADNIVSYVKKHRGPASVEIKTVEDTSTLTAEKKIGIVGVFPKFSGEEFENFTAIAEKLRADYEFGHTKDANLLPHGDSSVTGPVIRLLKPFDEPFVDIKDFNTDAVEKFIEETSTPIVTEYTGDLHYHPYVKKFFNNPNAKAMLFLNFSSEVDAFRPKYHEVAEKYRKEGISFLLGDLETSERALQYIGVKEDQAPVIVIQTSDGKKYLKANVKPENIADWVKDYKDGKVQQYIKSAPIPEENNESVKVVVADSLQDMVFNSGKNVLLEFYAPWCGHCKKLAPILEEVAVSYENDPDVVIAKFDATANDIISDFEVKGYPTMYFISKSGKLFGYDEKRSKEDIIAFIEKNRDKSDKQAEGQADNQAEDESNEQADKQFSGKDEL